VRNYLHRIRKYWTEKMLNDLPPKGSLLDLGCSEGIFTFEQSSKRDIVIGVDIALSKLKKAKSYVSVAKNVEFIAADAENLPFVDRAFDVVLCLELLEHLPDYLKGLDEISRVCKKTLVISVPGSVTLPTKIVLKVFGKLGERFGISLYGSGHLHIIGIEKLVKELRKSFLIHKIVNSAAIGAFPWGQLGNINWAIIQRMPSRISSTIVKIVESIDKKVDENSKFSPLAAHWILIAVNRKV